MLQHGAVRLKARLVRGWAAAILSTSLAGLSHCAADASTPHPVLLLVALAGAGPVCVLLAGRRMGPVRGEVLVEPGRCAEHPDHQVLALIMPLIPAARPVHRTGAFLHHGLHGTGWVRGAISRRGPPAPVV
ncbi:hypothetical protein [Kocuria nitroreducens]|uniref:hypothetical protein n=1 Tax=Kocuria nitroreducens TaxID=3058914 RepID=UPI0036DDAB7F